MKPFILLFLCFSPLGCKESALSRCNSCSISFAYLKYTIQLFKCIQQSCMIITTTSLRIVFLTPQSHPVSIVCHPHCPPQPYTPALVKHNLFSVSVDLLFWIFYRDGIKHEVCGSLELVSLTQYSACKVHWCCGTCQYFASICGRITPQFTIPIHHLICMSLGPMTWRRFSCAVWPFVCLCCTNITSFGYLLQLLCLFFMCSVYNSFIQFKIVFSLFVFSPSLWCPLNTKF